MTRADQERADREWRRVLDEHAHALFQNAIGQPAGVRSLAPLGGRPAVEIQGPDGEWRRYYVRLTEVK